MASEASEVANGLDWDRACRGGSLRPSLFGQPGLGIVLSAEVGALCLNRMCRLSPHVRQLKCLASEAPLVEIVLEVDVLLDNMRHRLARGVTLRRGRLLWWHVAETVEGHVENIGGEMFLESEQINQLGVLLCSKNNGFNVLGKK